MLIRIFLWQFFDLLCICYLSRKELSILHYNFWGFLILALEPASCKSSCNQGMPRHETILYHLEQQELHRQVSLRHFWLCLFQKRSPKSNLTKSSFRQFKHTQCPEVEFGQSQKLCARQVTLIVPEGMDDTRRARKLSTCQAHTKVEGSWLGDPFGSIQILSRSCTITSKKFYTLYMISLTSDFEAFRNREPSDIIITCNPFDPMNLKHYFGIPYEALALTPGFSHCLVSWWGELCLRGAGDDCDHPARLQCWTAGLVFRTREEKRE